MRGVSSVLQSVVCIAAIGIGSTAQAHHSSLLYDKDKLVTVDGYISYAKFGNPHSRFEITFEKNGQEQVWVMIAQDPRDAKRFGYYNDLKSLEVGQKIKTVGWPHKRNQNEILGQNMIAPNGKIIELIPIEGYVRPQMYQIMDWAVLDPDVSKHVIADEDDLSGAMQLQKWVMADHPIARAAVEVQLGHAKLIATTLKGAPDYHGMPKYLICQAEDDYGIVYSRGDFKHLPEVELESLVQWLSIYNRVLAKHWEIVRESCGQ